MPPDVRPSEEIQGGVFSLSKFLNEALCFPPSHPMAHQSTRMPDEWPGDILTNLLSSTPPSPLPLPSTAASSSIPSKRPISLGAEHSKPSKISRKNDSPPKPASPIPLLKTSTASEQPPSPSFESFGVRQSTSITNPQSPGISHNTIGELLILAGRHPGKECNAQEILDAFCKSLSDDNPEFKRQLAYGASLFADRGEGEAEQGPRTMYTCIVTSCRRSMTTAQSLRNHYACHMNISVKCGKCNSHRSIRSIKRHEKNCAGFKKTLTFRNKVT